MKLKKLAILVLSFIFTMGCLMTARADQIGKIEGLSLDEGGAYWDEAYVETDSTVRYELILYRGYSDKKVKTVKTKETYYDFSTIIAETGTGYYQFKVRALASGYTSGEWSELSNRLYVDSYLVSDYIENNKNDAVEPQSDTNNVYSTLPDPGWKQDAIGWWYCYQDNTYPHNEWKQIDGSWYFFHESGYMATGWLEYNGAKYYLSQSGAMVTGTQVIDGVTHQFRESGELIS